MQRLELDTAIVVTATFNLEMPTLDSMLPKRVSNLNTSFTHASILEALYKLSVSKEDKNL
jgi:hypothetical protein